MELLEDRIGRGYPDERLREPVVVLGEVDDLAL